MPLPSLLIVGAQKSGTTWLHRALKRSHHLVAHPRRKELDFFLRPDYAERLDDYAAGFPDDPKARYVFESSPNYFRPPTGDRDIAARIATSLPGVETLAILRNPVERYLSAYIHNMMKGRLPYTAEITDFTDDHLLLSHGDYAALLDHWWRHLPRLRVYFHDDLTANRAAFLTRVMADLGLDRDVPDKALKFRANARDRKIRDLDWDRMPVLSFELRERLRDHFAPGIARLQAMTGRDLSGWLADDQEAQDTQRMAQGSTSSRG